MIINYCPHCMSNNVEGNTVCSVCGKNLNVQNEVHQLPVNTILHGRYLIGKVIGQGGFGITYIGVELDTGERVAIKEFYPTGVVNRHHTHSLDLSVSQGDSASVFIQGREKFINEAKVLARFVDQPNIVSVKNYFTDNQTAYIVMEYLDGKSLQQLLSAKGKLSFEDAFSMLAPVIRALGKVHESGLIHRDISPSNIMLQRNGVLKLLDFGTARVMSKEGENSLSIVLKPGFAPEEQYRSHGEQGPWTDVYAMCATIYKLITGVTPENSLNRMFKDTLVLPSAMGAAISPAQEAVLLRGMAVHYSRRIQSMQELYDSMCAVLSSNQNAQGVQNKRQPQQPQSQPVYTPPVQNNGIPVSKPAAKGKAKGRKLGIALVTLAVAIAAIAVFGGGDSDEEESSIRPSASINTPPPVQATSTPEPVKDGWVYENGRNYYYVNGKAVTGWYYVDGIEYYFQSDGALAQNTSIYDQEDGVTYLFDDEGYISDYAFDVVAGSWSDINYYFASRKTAYKDIEPALAYCTSVDICVDFEDPNGNPENITVKTYLKIDGEWTYIDSVKCVDGYNCTTVTFDRPVTVSGMMADAEYGSHSYAIWLENTWCTMG